MISRVQLLSNVHVGLRNECDSLSGRQISLTMLQHSPTNPAFSHFISLNLLSCILCLVLIVNHECIRAASEGSDRGGIGGGQSAERQVPLGAGGGGKQEGQGARAAGGRGREEASGGKAELVGVDQARGLQIPVKPIRAESCD